MIEIFLNIIVGFLFLVIIWFLIQYGLKFRQERLKEEDYRNEILAEKARLSEERTIQKAKEKEEEKQQEYQNKLDEGYKYYVWKGVYNITHLNMFTCDEMYRTEVPKNGEGYFKSEEDLKKFLIAENIYLRWCREL